MRINESDTTLSLRNNKSFESSIPFNTGMPSATFVTEMRRFLVNRTSIENVNVVQPEVEVEEPPSIVANKFNSNEIVRDPGLRKQIHLYAPDIRDEVRTTYVLKGPIQPKLTRFPRTPLGSATRAFSKSWYNKYTWIEYSLKDHIGGHDSMHNRCIKHYDDYKNQRQSVISKFARAIRESE
ncbi:hypothetical protein MTR_6g066340 [Medicago truncatula]|uniref:Uncharacterized protein n=1 Tax=Medicago truncatula TaxID=3880 RepID=A0A072UC97_MEDTR|nr:hypothetical protein MTR_6g066340 [Medicago truncatula]